MSGRERLRRAAGCRFGKSGINRIRMAKPVVLEKNRCREEEEFPVVKGISKSHRRKIAGRKYSGRPDSSSEDLPGQSGVSEKGMLRGSAPRRMEAISAAGETNDRQAFCTAA